MASSLLLRTIRSTLYAIAAFLLASCARVQIVPAPAGVAEKFTIVSPSPTFPVGEKLTYQISWWGTPVAEAVLTVSRLTQGSMRGLIQLKCEASSNRYLDFFYPVRVKLTSFVHPKSHSPRRFEAYVKRRWRTHQSTITFDQEQGLALHELPKNRTATVPISAKTQDGLSQLYFARMLEFAVGREVPLTITADGKNWHLTGHLLRTGTVKVAKLGKWNAIEGDIQLSYPVPFFQGAKAWVWFSADSKRVPLMARIRSRVGPVTVVLREAQLALSEGALLE